MPDPAALAEALQPAPTARPPHEQSLVEPFREPVQRWRDQGIEGQPIWQLLVEQHVFTGSYSSLKRFLHRLAPPEVRATVRIEVAPGDEAQVDFGYAGQPALGAVVAPTGFEPVIEPRPRFRQQSRRPTHCAVSKRSAAPKLQDR